MNARALSKELKKIADEYKAKADNKSLDAYDRSFNAGLAQGLYSANIELMENILKGDIR